MHNDKELRFWRDSMDECDASDKFKRAQAYLMARMLANDLQAHLYLFPTIKDLTRLNLKNQLTLVIESIEQIAHNFDVGKAIP